jgi:hypothetical protein
LTPSWLFQFNNKLLYSGKQKTHVSVLAINNEPAARHIYGDKISNNILAFGESNKINNAWLKTPYKILIMSLSWFFFSKFVNFFSIK